MRLALAHENGTDSGTRSETMAVVAEAVMERVSRMWPFVYCEAEIEDGLAYDIAETSAYMAA